MKAPLPLCSVGALKIYFAGPLFTPYERSFIDECAAALRADGFEVFVPHEHELATSVDVTAAWIFAKDRPGIERADAMLAILNGPSGTGALPRPINSLSTAAVNARSGSPAVMNGISALRFSRRRFENIRSI